MKKKRQTLKEYEAQKKSCFSNEQIRCFIIESSDILEGWFKDRKLQYVRNGTKFIFPNNDFIPTQFDLYTLLAFQEIIDKYQLKVSCKKLLKIVNNFINKNK